MMRADFQPEHMDTRADTSVQVLTLPEEVIEQLALQTTASSIDSLTYRVASRKSELFEILSVVRV